jgi:pimeloyl-ACP methyl ester carboxylesterase
MIDGVPPRPLAHLAGESPPAPDWFARAVAAPHEDGAILVEGARVAWRRWGEPGRPGLLFVHGGLAHKSWWDFIAPFFMETHCVAAIDLSGMGDSDERAAYRMDLYGRELIAVCEAARLFEGREKPVIAGHSFGGWAALQCARDHGELLRMAIVLDSPIRPPEQQRRQTPPARPRRLYRSEAEGVTRFHLLPDQDSRNLFLLDHIARTGLKREGEGWTWKFDPDLWSKLTYGADHPSEFLHAIPCPLAVIRGEESALMTDEIWAYMHTIMPEGSPMIGVPDAGHHLMMDQPIAVIATLRALLAAG